MTQTDSDSDFVDIFDFAVNCLNFDCSDVWEQVCHPDVLWRVLLRCLKVSWFYRVWHLDGCRPSTLRSNSSVCRCPLVLPLQRYLPPMYIPCHLFTSACVSLEVRFRRPLLTYFIPAVSLILFSWSVGQYSFAAVCIPSLRVVIVWLRLK